MQLSPLVNEMARAICRERCAFMGEPACWEICQDEPWPPDVCDDPGCIAMAMAAESVLPPERKADYAAPPAERPPE